ncbi:preprotein translocase subunit Sec61beta [Candidatus Woesearchaeota archaeon]|nr:MAG: preprotein translocase subunit Sec61beta [Candidatus Woesearchaeota archaeon]
MARKDKIAMPSSGAGITRYFDEIKSRYELKPEHVMVLCIIVVLIVISLHVLWPIGAGP